MIFPQIYKAVLGIPLMLNTRKHHRAEQSAMEMPDNPDHVAQAGGAIGPVTVIVTRRARKGKSNEFEQWMDGILHAAMKFEGHMGVNVVRPLPPGRDYTIIFRFDTYSHLTQWENSPIR